MRPEAVHRETCELCWALVDGRLDPSGAKRLESLVQGDAAARRTYVQFMFLRGGLLWDKAAGATSAEIASELSTAGCSRPAIGRRRAFGARSLGWSALAAAATLLIAVGVWFARLPAPQTSLRPSASPFALTAEASARWDTLGRAPRAGEPLAPGRWRLREGLAAVRLGASTTMVVEGPAVLGLESARSVELRGGRITLAVGHGGTLRVDTPQAAIVDLGTRFAVGCDERRTEVHVVEGAVEVGVRRRGIEEATATRIRSGESYEFVEGAPPRRIAAAAGRFAWQVSPPALHAPELLAYEGFVYRGATLGSGGGGMGWSGPWYGFDDLSRESTALLIEGSSLANDAFPFRALGGHIAEDVNDWGFRALERPLDLDRDGAYYVSFLLRKLNPGMPGQGRWAGLSLLEGPAERVFFGTQDGGFRIAQLGQPVEAGTLEPGTTYFFVAKIAASADEADQPLLKVYGPGEAVDAEEPRQWTVVGTRDTRLKGALDRVRIASETGYEIDEIRVGLTWQAVAGGAPER